MFFLIHQTNDLTEVSGFGFTSLERSIRDASIRIGQQVRAVEAVVRLENGPDFPCWVAMPFDGLTHFAREGHMTLIAQLDDAMHIAMRLCRRNGLYGQGQVVMQPSM